MSTKVCSRIAALPCNSYGCELKPFSLVGLNVPTFFLLLLYYNIKYLSPFQGSAGPGGEELGEPGRRLRPRHGRRGQQVGQGGQGEGPGGAAAQEQVRQEQGGGEAKGSPSLLHCMMIIFCMGRNFGFL